MSSPDRPAARNPLENSGDFFVGNLRILRTG
jgi:hypothetical protein